MERGEAQLSCKQRASAGASTGLLLIMTPRKSYYQSHHSEMK